MIAVIGAGVVGLAVAAELSRTGDVLVVEQHDGYGRETSSHNSGVVHAGIYYPTGSLKHTLCLEGNRLLYEWCARYGVRALRLGKLIVAVDAGEEEALERVRAQAEANAVPGIRKLTPTEATALEPAVRCHAALFSETSGVVDQMGLMRSLAAAATERGAMLAFRHCLEAAERPAGGFRITLRDSEGERSDLECDALVNCAGLAADQVAALLGYPLDGEGETPRLRQTVNKGRYYDLVTPAKARRLRHLIYPVPEQRLEGLGVHVTIDVDGGAHLGPDTEWLPEGASLDYRADDVRRDAFWHAARRYLLWLERDDIAPGQVGYRPKLQRPGEQPRDFLLWHDRGYVHLGGIESPGLTASLAIARRVADMLR